MVERAATLGLHALAVTDRNSVAGVVRAHQAAKDRGVRLILGAELTPADGPPLVVWVPDRSAWADLCRLLTLGKLRVPKGQCHLTVSDVLDHGGRLLAGVLPVASVDDRTPLADDVLGRFLGRYREAFGDRLHLLLERHGAAQDRTRLLRQAALARRRGVPLLAANDVHYHDRSRQPLQDVLTALRHRSPLTAATGLLFANGERHLKSPATMNRMFAGIPQAVANTVAVARRCAFSLDELRYEYPIEACPEGRRPVDYLTDLAWSGAKKRYGPSIPPKVRGMLHHELTLIAELQYAAYFLTVWDIARFARSQGILCQGRGSAANSAVCFCLGVTEVDPAVHELLFERFLSKERDEPPDIDIDFEHQRREEVLQYVYAKYGRERAGMTAEVVTYRTRSALRDVAKTLGLPEDRIGRLSTLVGDLTEFDAEHAHPRFREGGLDPHSVLGRQVFTLAGQLLRFPRHLSQHVGGMVLSRCPLADLVPVENAAMPGRTVIGWDKDDLDALGILKVDCLGLGMLSALRRALRLIDAHHRRPNDNPLTLATVPKEDPAVYRMIQRADTVGVFQIESRAQMTMLPRLKPARFFDLVIEVAIVRPGPIQGKMVHPYLKRRQGLESVTYPTPEVKAVLERTLGVPLFQEQAMQLAVVAAGFTPGEADELRRAISAWRHPGAIDNFRRKLLTGMQERGMPEEFAQRVFRQIEGFGQYGFPESHAASFALLVYASCWIKHHYPDAFLAALVNSQPMGFYRPAQLVRDARDHGVTVLPPDVNHSDWDCTLEPPAGGRRPDLQAVRLGLRLIHGLRRTDADRIAAARRPGPFASLEDFYRRTRLLRAAGKLLADAAAFGSLSLDRRPALWHALADPGDRPVVLADLPEADASSPDLPDMSSQQHVWSDYRTTGLSLRAHPLRFVRAHLHAVGVTPAGRLPTLRGGAEVAVAGLVLFRQRPGTAKGITFITLEDETGICNLIVMPDIWERHRAVGRTAAALIVHGRLERQGVVIHLKACRLEPLDQRCRLPGGLSNRSRDFR